MLVTVIYEAVSGGALSGGTANASLVNFAQIAFGGSSLLIVVGVAIEIVRELEAQLSLRNYKGFLD
jgi:preprotein translocase subunit SecY